MASAAGDASSSRSAAAASASAAAESYVGSLISLTSKSDIRYEGILSSINTQESSIALRNVRSFGTEGRRDGPQIPASDKVYEYILFRGSDIKDLQVKAPPPAQPTSIHNDPAIIQSHFSHPGSAPTSLPSAGSGTASELSSHTAQLGLQRSTFQGGLPLYQPGGSLGSWGSSALPPTANGSGLAMPMYWQGFYAPSAGLPHLQPPHLLHPPPGLPIPHSMQQSLQYSGMNMPLPSGSPNLPGFPPPLLPPVSSTIGSTSTVVASTLAPTQASVLPPETPAAMMEIKTSVTSLPALNSSANLPLAPLFASTPESTATLTQSMPSIVSSNSRTVPSSNLAPQTVSHSVPSVNGSSRPSQLETSVPLVTPGQLMQPGPSALPSSHQVQENRKDAVFKPQETKIEPSVAEPLLHAPAESKEPILPLPRSTNQKPGGASLYTHHSNRGHSRGRRNGYSRPVTKYTEDFDFIAMNEKFNKDEVWGHLGKSKAHLRDREGELKEDEADDILEEDVESQNLEIKAVYVKDDFFDSLSCDTHDRGTQSGRTKFSEQLKIDTETFGNFPRHRTSRGGGRGFRGGRTRGSYFGRGYGYIRGGRGHTTSNRA